MIRIAAVALALLLLSGETRAHCDSMNGPVVAAGQKALDAKDVRLALIWVKPADEKEIKTAFDRTLAVRSLGKEARNLADRYFFETLVRVHRAGEGAPFTGLKESDVQPEPGIASAEQALQAGSIQNLAGELSAALLQQLRRSFERVQHSKDFTPVDVDAGRHYVENYVSYIHFVERLHIAVTPPDNAHEAEVHVH